MGAYATAVLADSPVSFYDLDETSGTTATDTQGAANGTYTGSGITYALRGESGSAVQFNGTTGQMTATLRLSATASVTLEAWFYCTDITQSEQCIIYNGSYGIFISGAGTTNGRLYGLYQNVRWIDTNYQLRSNQWYHVALVIDASGHPSLYINGRLVYSDSGSTPVALTTNSAAGSQGDSTRFFKGLVDGAAFYNSALTAAKVLAHHDAGEQIFTGATLFPHRPVGDMRPNWTHPLTQGLLVAMPGGQLGDGIPINRVNQKVGTSSSGSTTGYGWGNSLYGRTNFASVLGTSANITFSHKSINQNHFTVEVWFLLTAYQLVSPFISGIWTNFAGGGSINLRLGDTNLPWNCLELGSNPAFALNRPHQIILSVNSGSGTLLVNGALVDTFSVSGATVTSTSILRDDTNGRSFSGPVEAVHVWDRPLSVADAIERWNDPWGIYNFDGVGIPLEYLVANPVTQNPLLMGSFDEWSALLP